MLPRRDTIVPVPLLLICPPAVASRLVSAAIVPVLEMLPAVALSVIALPLATRPVARTAMSPAVLVRLIAPAAPVSRRPLIVSAPLLAVTAMLPSAPRRPVVTLLPEMLIVAPAENCVALVTAPLAETLILASRLWIRSAAVPVKLIAPPVVVAAMP